MASPVANKSRFLEIEFPAGKPMGIEFQSNGANGVGCVVHKIQNGSSLRVGDRVVAIDGNTTPSK
jgi:hypothetical protein